MRRVTVGTSISVSIEFPIPKVSYAQRNDGLGVSLVQRDPGVTRTANGYCQIGLGGSSVGMKATGALFPSLERHSPSIGLEYRFTPHIGIFGEIAYVFSNLSNNNFIQKFGLRLVFQAKN
jgi:hypothetical protein